MSQPQGIQCHSLKEDGLSKLERLNEALAQEYAQAPNKTLSELEALRENKESL